MSREGRNSAQTTTSSSFNTSSSSGGGVTTSSDSPSFASSSSSSSSSFRLISFENFKNRSSFPRYPEDAQCVVDFANLSPRKRKKSFFIFISHCWLRGHADADGYDGRPHPDNATHDKFKICVKGIENAMKYLAPGSKQCYIWFDFVCLNQDGGADIQIELEQLYEIIRHCDCLFTPIHGENRNKEYCNHYDDYNVAAWNEGPYSYTHRAWTRLEMLYAANIPVVEESKLRAKRLYKHGLKVHLLAGRRPHLLYGTTESNSKRIPLILPPLQYKYYDKLDPKTGNLTDETGDRPKIEKLFDNLKPYFKHVEASYEGGRDSNGKMSGKGIFHYPDGATYDGDFFNDKRSGKGSLFSADSTIYKGDFFDDKISGKGLFRYPDGATYKGDLLDGKRSGKGILRFAKGSNVMKQEGNFLNGKLSGKGIMYFKDGYIYEGNFLDGRLAPGKGTVRYPEKDLLFGDCYFLGKWRHRNVYEGDYILTQNLDSEVQRLVMSAGKGILRYRDGATYKGEFHNDKIYGRGIATYPGGTVCEGYWINNDFSGTNVCFWYLQRWRDFKAYYYHAFMRVVAMMLSKCSSTIVLVMLALVFSFAFSWLRK